MKPCLAIPQKTKREILQKHNIPYRCNISGCQNVPFGIIPCTGDVVLCHKHFTLACKLGYCGVEIGTAFATGDLEIHRAVPDALYGLRRI